MRKTTVGTILAAPEQCRDHSLYLEECPPSLFPGSSFFPFLFFFISSLILSCFLTSPPLSLSPISLTHSLSPQSLSLISLLPLSLQSLLPFLSTLNLSHPLSLPPVSLLTTPPTPPALSSPLSLFSPFLNLRYEMFSEKKPFPFFAPIFPLPTHFHTCFLGKDSRPYFPAPHRLGKPLKSGCFFKGGGFAALNQTSTHWPVLAGNMSELSATRSRDRIDPRLCRLLPQVGGGRVTKLQP